MPQEQAINEALLSIQSVSQERNQSISDFGLPLPQEHSHEILQEISRWLPFRDLFLAEVDDCLHSMIHKQQLIYDQILTSVSANTPLLLFIEACAGQGKTYIIDTIYKAF